jgi:TonB-linked SusC/RagA family outer membrane protein
MEIKLTNACFQLRKQLLKFIMRTFIFLCCVTVFGLSPINIVSQNSRINIEESQLLSVDEVFDLVMEQTDYKFFYEEGLFKDFAKVHVKKGKIITNKLLERSLSQGDMDVKMTDNNVILITAKSVETGEVIIEELQTHVVSGIVTDRDGNPLPGVSIVKEGTSVGVETDFDGKFTIKINKGEVLVLSYLGMETKKITIDDKTFINVVMQESTDGLDEVVIVGYGSQRKSNLTGSVASVKSKALSKLVVANATNSLAGQLPGLISQQSNGMPGRDNASLSIRGFGNALVIVDGIEAEINTLDPSTIESVSILKDGSASIYGARAGNGVILVTTKRGTTDAPSINLSSTYTLQGNTRFFNKASSGQYAEMKREEAINSGANEPFSAEDVQNFYNETDPYLYPNTDWESFLLRDWAPQQQHNLSVRGGSEKIKYYGFVGYMNQETVWKLSDPDFTRYHIQSNIDAQINDQLSLRFDFTNINGLVRTTQQDQFGYPNNSLEAWGKYHQHLSMFPATLPDPSKRPFAGLNSNLHILMDRDYFGYRDTKTNDYRTTLSLNYDFKSIKGLSAKIFFNSKQKYRSMKYMQKPASYYDYDSATDTYTVRGSYGSKAQSTESRNFDKQNTTQISLNYNRTFKEDHHVSGLFLHESIDISGNSLVAARINFLTPNIEQLFAGSTEGMTNDGSAFEMGRSSFVTRANYRFKNKYYIETSLRADASAKFSEEKRWGYFPSVSLGWAMSEEGFMENFDSIDRVKLRASYGTSGNDSVGNFQYLSGFVYGGTELFSDIQQGIVSSGLPNPNLSWEEVAIYNIGVDFSLWNRKLYGEVDAFYRTREGVIGTRLASLPSTVGAALPPENLNSINNRGFELKVGTSGNISDLQYDLSANLSWARSKWDSFDEPVYDDPEQDRIYRKSGRWTDRRFGYVSDGLFGSQAEIDNLGYDMDGQNNATLSPGDVRYLDMNNDGIIDWEDQQEIGKGTTPLYMFGFTFDLTYKNFDLSALFQGAAGHFSSLNFILNTETFYNNRWTPENNDTNALVPRLGGAPSNGWGSDYRYRNSSYLRLKNLNIGYNVSQALLDKSTIKQCRIFLSGFNLFSIDGFKKYDLDPEFPSGGGGRYYPQQKTVSIGINLTL